MPSPRTLVAAITVMAAYAYSALRSRNDISTTDHHSLNTTTNPPDFDRAYAAVDFERDLCSAAARDTLLAYLGDGIVPNNASLRNQRLVTLCNVLMHAVANEQVPSDMRIHIENTVSPMRSQAVGTEMIGEFKKRVAAVLNNDLPPHVAEALKNFTVANKAYRVLDALVSPASPQAVLSGSPLQYVTGRGTSR